MGILLWSQGRKNSCFEGAGYVGCLEHKDLEVLCKILDNNNKNKKKEKAAQTKKPYTRKLQVSFFLALRDITKFFILQHYTNS